MKKIPYQKQFKATVKRPDGLIEVFTLPIFKKTDEAVSEMHKAALALMKTTFPDFEIVSHGVESGNFIYTQE